MPQRFTPLVNGQYYHVFNRGVAKLPIFTSQRDYKRFITTLEYYHFAHVPVKLSYLLLRSAKERVAIFDQLQQKHKASVSIICYCLLPNHFHLLLRQETDNGISNFMRTLQDSYTKYYNTKNDRVGPLLQGAFKSVRMESDEQLLHVSRYIHINPLTSFLVNEKGLLDYPWSSLPAYTSNTRTFIDSEAVLGHFHDIQSYKSFLLDQADYAKSLEELKHLDLESEKRPQIYK